MSSDAVVLVEQPEPGVALLRLNRPAVLNALSNAVMNAIGEALEKFAADGQTRAVTRIPGHSGVEYQFVFTFTRPLPSTISGYKVSWIGNPSSASGDRRNAPAPGPRRSSWPSR